MKEYKFIIGDRTYTVLNERELSLIFDVLGGEDEMSSVVHWNIIMQLDEDLIDIIKTYKGLLECLKKLNEKNAFLLVFKVADNLSNIIENSLNFGELLARLPEEENKLRIIKHIRKKGLEQIILNSSDLSNILEWIYDKTERELLNMLGEEFLRKILIKPSDIYNVLPFLNDENKDYLTNIIGLKSIIKNIDTFQDLLFILKGCTLKSSRQLLDKYKKEDILKLFNNDKEFHSFLKKLSDRKEKMFLEYFGK
ncbi:MAG: hypothetical protein PHF46_02305 [Candidatus Gracilibacteria bacterium]|nr:hypothetical protein [Candidatus Gracilibacteria bacterium]MDD3120214.1 hypothetical protein [Candidatus Gracilibacteria bacterium]MDD4529964.1 hypothetical protein [Candidatus Gracilibacteria bacterium]